MLRFALPADAPALRAIYAQYIGTSVTFEFELPSAAEFARRIEEVSAFYPYLVWEEDGRILGYAYAHRFAERAAYQWSAELSVYVDMTAHARGVGKRLYAALIDLVRLQGVRTVYGLVTSPNEKSERFHEALGFASAGVTKNVGFKNGGWHGVTTYELPIAPYDDMPAPPKPIRTLDEAAVAAILQKHDS